jgi:DNA-binding transcriptional LysR family regulator
MDRIGDIGLFLRVLDLGSISAAARSLDLSVAVASQRLQRLERDLGVRLLHRTTRRLHATPEGAILAEQGRVLVEDLEALSSSLRQAGAGVTGTLRLTTSASFGRQYVSPLLPDFLRAHPGVNLSIDLTDHVLDLVSSGYDLAIRIGALEDSTLVARKLADNQRLLCASPAYLREHGYPESPADLVRHQCLVWGRRAAPTSGASRMAAVGRLRCACAAGSRPTPANCCRTRRWRAVSRCIPSGMSAKTCGPGGWCRCFRIFRWRSTAFTR